MTEANFDNEKFFVDTVIVGAQYIINDLPDPFRGSIVALDVKGEFIYRIDNNANVWFNQDTIWKVLYEKNNWHYLQTKEFLEAMLAKYLKNNSIKVLKSQRLFYTDLEKLLNSNPIKVRPSPSIVERRLKKYVKIILGHKS